MEPAQIYNHDPLMVLLRKTLRMSNFWILIIFLVVTLGCFYGLYSLPNISAKLVNETDFALLETFTACLVYIAYLWLPDVVSSLLNSLKKEQILYKALNGQDLDVAYKNFCERFLAWMNHIVWPLGTLIFVLLYLLNRYLAGGPPFIILVPEWLQFVTAVLDGFIAYCAFMCIIRFIISLVFINLLLQSFTVYVNPLHPDGCGGFGALRHILWVTVAIILATTMTFFETVQLSIANNIPSSPLDAVMLTTAYLILAPSLVIAWLALPHYLMRKARQAALLPLANEFQQIATNPSWLTDEELSDISANTDRLSAIKRRYDLLVETFPKWPVEVKQLRRIIAALSLPALIPLFPYISSLFKALSNFLLK